MSSQFKVRCAPSPSGSLHCGNLKTFIFNYLYSSKHKCDFILRIEDTDQSRAVPNGAENILEELEWVGLKPNMGYGTSNKPAGVYTQMERLAIYKKYAEELLAKNLAYKCYCTEKDLNNKREEALALNPKSPFAYPGTCADLTESKDLPYVVRLRTPKEGITSFEDTTFGKRDVPNKENYDYVIMRSNGIPLFAFANCIDDGIIDGITHVIRGSDHLKNMVQCVLIYKALGIPLPSFTHLPILRNKDGGKLSKRDSAVSVAEYRKAGYSPQAILNYLVRFGWGHGDQEIFSLQEMIDKFTLEACHCRDGKFDPVKFANLNYIHLKSEELTPTPRYVELTQPFLRAKGVEATDEQVTAFIPVIRSRAKTFVEAATLLEPLLRTEVTFDTQLMGKTFNQVNAEYLKCLGEVLASVESWDEAAIRAKVQSWLTVREISLKDVGGVLRLALLGTAHSPEIFQVLSALGKERVGARIHRCLDSVNYP